MLHRDNHTDCHSISSQAFWCIISILQTYLSLRLNDIILVEICGAIFLFYVWIQSRTQRVCDLYFCGLVLAAVDTLKGRLNSTRIYSALGSNRTLWFSAFCIWVGTCQCAILLNVPFRNFLTVSVFVHFVYFNTNYSTSIGTPVLIYSVFFLFDFFCFQYTKQSSVTHYQNQKSGK